MKKIALIHGFLIMIVIVETASSQIVEAKPETLKYEPFIWPSEILDNCPFKQSESFNAIKFLGLKSGFHYGDTWYPTWAQNDTLYSPWTDGTTMRLDGNYDNSNSAAGPHHNQSATGIIIGSDPMTMKAYSTGIFLSRSNPYQGRYPCGSLVHNGVWYYGTYCLGPEGSTKFGALTVNWPWLGPFVGFRYSTNYGRSWTETPHTPDSSIFRETGINGHPVKIGSPHFVDFGKNMEHSPDGKAYLVAHGADMLSTATDWRFWNNSWITGDQIYLLRVSPSIENMNDISKYEFYGGKDANGNSIWTKNFGEIKPLLEWNNNMGCVTITYNAPLKKYLMCVTDGGNTVSKMNTYILESDRLDGDWKIITFLKDFGEQAYFVNIPSKFISIDGRQMWLLYSGNFAPDWNGQKIAKNPPGSHYGMVFQKIQLVK